MQGGRHVKTYPFTMTAGKNYVIDMITREGDPKKFDPYLGVRDPGGKAVAQDDDSGGFPNARITFSCGKTSTYTIIATTCGQNMTGKFLLTAREESNADAGKDNPP